MATARRATRAPRARPTRERAAGDVLLHPQLNATLADRVRFAEEHLHVKTGERFSLEGRRWIVDEFWGPADGFKLWPVDTRALCDDCKIEAGQIVHDWVPAHDSRSAAHAAIGCKGLELQPIILTLINVTRQEGKTTAGMGYDLSTIFKQRNKHLAFVTASEDQTARLIAENYQNALDRNPRLAKRCRRVGMELRVPKTNSKFTGMSTSANSVVGSSFTHVRLDEAKHVPNAVFAALLPSIFARNGWECPVPGHYHQEGLATPTRRTCHVCGSRLVPWYGRLIATSSSPLLEDGEEHWFPEMVEQLLAQPDPNMHVYKRDTSENPSVSQTVRGVAERLGQLNSLRDYMEAEVSNTARRKGDDFVSSSELNAVFDRDLTPSEGSTAPCVGFLDTSLSHDLTSLVLLADDPVVGVDEPWRRLVALRMDVWDPADYAGGVIDDEAVWRHLEEYLPLFPNLRVLGVDDHMQPWAIKLVKRARGKGWGKAVQSVNAWKDTESQIGWNLFEESIRERRIRLLEEDRVRREVRGIKRVRNTDGSTKVVDRNRKKMHRDVSESIACACYLAHLESMKRRTALSTVNSRTAKSVLSRLTRPGFSGLNTDKF